MPYIAFSEAHDTPLAVVGGGPSAGQHLEELKEWPGHIWAINQGAAWLAHVAPKAMVWMFTVDPDPLLAQPQWVAGVQRAILGLCVSPKLVEALKGKDVRLFDPHVSPDSEDGMTLAGGPSSVCRTFVPAMWMGYKTVTYFGCEGSIGDTTHAYRNETRDRQMVVRCGEQDFVTTPDLYLSTIALSKAIREYSSPNAGLREKSGGLLRGMLEHPDTWEVVAYSEALAKTIDPSAIGGTRYYPKAA